MDEHGIENHPELMDPDWQRHAEKEAWVDLQRNRRRAHRGRRLAIFAVVLVVVAGAGFAFYRWGKTTSEQYTDASPAGAPVAGAASAATTTAPTDLPDFANVDLSRPFENTPAQNWAEGIAGLSIPPATKVGTFSAKQVSSALDQVKQAISVAQFDQDTLDGHNPAKYLALLAPYARDNVRKNPASYLTYLAGGYHLLPVTPRMTGSVTAKAGRAGELVLHAEYVVAYAFDPGDQVVYGPADIEPFIRVGADYVFRTGSSWESTARGLGLDDFGTYSTDIACQASKDGVLAPAFSEPDFDATSLTPEPGRFDPGKPMPTQGNCR
ncbi:hypothetical protein LWP59_09090 [Amycolatopsis acidiphila]|uniref:Uncharacterized protein n=1 Tax=Amycolatopsis acidiphila TaxID=715473 RepID=A0A558A3M6_9PSEU|nr:hypothetical protein [Amycolatopsis acidiphila]TVT18836.1 hypothetical protein FNH06_26375 [Amycolatopsis acidiphila]UIJ61756.1 hypothetical protein LWP59_09090 [Amycolatopsis acidiphila]GHG58037.1 hypothetical protein GCM10017788_10300 [Amycolatopsis acidiphila]